MEGIALFSKPRKKLVKDACVKEPPAATDQPKPPADTRQKSEADARTEGETSTAGPSIASFKGLGLTDWLCSVCRSLGMVKPTSVQQACIPAVLSGRDVIGLASTGSGKTAAFGKPHAWGGCCET